MTEVPDPWRLDEWRSLPDTCAIAGCENDEADQRGPVNLKDGTMLKVCPEHWEPIFRVLGEQATWESTDAFRGLTTHTCTCPRIDGYRIRSKSCPTHAECLNSVGPVPKLDGESFVCVKPVGHEMPHAAPDGTWWEGER